MTARAQPEKLPYPGQNGHPAIDPASLRNGSLETPSRIETWGRLLVILIGLIWAAAFLIGFQVSLTILTVVGFISAIAGLRYPALGLLGIGILATMDGLTRTYLLSGGILRWNTFNYWLLFVIGLNLVLFLRLNNIFVRLLQLFVLLLTLELIISPDISQGMQDTLNIVSYFGLLIYLIRARPGHQEFFWLAAVSGVSGALAGLVFYLQVDAIPYINPNSWGFMPLTALVCICMAYFYQDRPGNWRIPLLVLAGVNAIWIAFSGSRGTILSALVCLVYLFLASRRVTWKAAMLFITTLLALWFSVNFVEQQEYLMQRINKSFDPTASLAERTSGRSVILEAGLKVFTRNPLGVGTGGFEEASGEGGILNDEGRPAHSAWVKVLAENGIPGVLMLAIFLMSFTLVGLNRKPRSMAILGLLVTVMLAVTFISKEYQGKGLWLLAAGVTIMMNMEEAQRVVSVRSTRYPLRRQFARQREPRRLER